jgi:hypothetical protein
MVRTGREYIIEAFTAASSAERTECGLSDLPGELPHVERQLYLRHISSPI